MSTDPLQKPNSQEYEPFWQTPLTHSLLKDPSYTIHHPTADPKTTNPPSQEKQDAGGNPFFRRTCNSEFAVRHTLFLSRTHTRIRTRTQPPIAQSFNGAEAEAEADPGVHAEGRLLLHLGPGVTGQSGIAHGGFLATVLDEVCGNLVAVARLDGGLGMFTASLGLTYKRPVFVGHEGTVVVASARVVRVEGRKVFIEGVIRDVDGVECTAAEAIFVRKRAVEAQAVL
ncbi:HotDog domain-containing protein [Aspergillus multicolor]|uniref:PaaI family thioesterase n=1 Tax=Aspergillus multicolor TaxID=41759 RepID=UPI003CCE06F6